MGELVSSVSTMLHCQMMRDADASDKRKQMLPFFHEEEYTKKPAGPVSQGATRGREREGGGAKVLR